MRFPCALEREKNEHTQMTKRGRETTRASASHQQAKHWAEEWLSQLKLRLPGSGHLAQPKQISSRNFCDVPEPHLGVNYFSGKADLQGCSPRGCSCVSLPPRVPTCFRGQDCQKDPSASRPAGRAQDYRPEPPPSPSHTFLGREEKDMVMFVLTRQVGQTHKGPHFRASVREGGWRPTLCRAQGMKLRGKAQA